MLNEILFVTSNSNKFGLARKVFDGSTIDLLQIELDIPEIQSFDVEEIMKFKLEYAFKEVKKPCFVLDTALYFDCLGGFPGPFVKFYFQREGAEKRTCEIALGQKQFGAKNISMVGFHDGEKVHFFGETILGRISDTPKGDNGFDWDTIFIPEGSNKTYAEMTFEEKSKYAPSITAIQKLREFLE